MYVGIRNIRFRQYVDFSLQKTQNLHHTFTMVTRNTGHTCTVCGISKGVNIIGEIVRKNKRVTGGRVCEDTTPTVQKMYVGSLGK